MDQAATSTTNKQTSTKPPSNKGDQDLFENKLKCAAKTIAAERCCFSVTSQWDTSEKNKLAESITKCSSLCKKSKCLAECVYISNILGNATTAKDRIQSPTAQDKSTRKTSNYFHRSQITSTKT